MGTVSVTNPIRMYPLKLEKEMNLEQIKESTCNNTSTVSNKVMEHVIPKAEIINVFLKVNKGKKSNRGISMEGYFIIYP